MVICLATGLCGKLPFHGDFLRLGVSRDDADLLDRIFAAPRALAGEDPWSRATLPVCAVLRRGNEYLLAVLFPSADAVGRRYPFIAVAHLPVAWCHREVPLLVAAAVRFFHRIIDRVTRLHIRDESELGELRAVCDLDLDGDHLAAAASALLDNGSATALWKGSWGDAPGDRPWQALATLLAAGHEGVDLLRVDGVVSETHVHFYAVAAWLTRARRHLPALLVLHPPGAAAGGRLYLGWGSLDEAQIAACMWPELGGDHAVRVPAAEVERLPSAASLRTAIAQAGDGIPDVLYALQNAGEDVVT